MAPRTHDFATDAAVHLYHHAFYHFYRSTPDHVLDLVLDLDPDPFDLDDLDSRTVFVFGVLALNDCVQLQFSHLFALTLALHVAFLTRILVWRELQPFF